MVQSAEVLKPGRYALDQSLIVTIEHAKAQRTMRVHRKQKPFTVTSTTRVGQTWRIEYMFNRRTRFGMLTEVPTR